MTIYAPAKHVIFFHLVGQFSGAEIIFEKNILPSTNRNYVHTAPFGVKEYIEMHTPPYPRIGGGLHFFEYIFTDLCHDNNFFCSVNNEVELIFCQKN